MPHRQAAAELLGEAEQVELGAELAVVALGRLLEAVQVLFELGLRGPRRAVDALQLRVLLVAPPVRAGHAHQLEVAEVTAGVLDVRAATEVDEPGRVLVRAHEARLRGRHRVGRRVVDDLELVLVILEEHARRIGPDLVADEGLLLLDDLAHARFDAREVVFLEVLAVGKLEVVVEAVLDGRTDAERGAREQVEHGLRQHVGRRVADRVEAAVARRRDDGDLVAVGQRPHQIALDAVDAGDHRRLAQARSDLGGQITGRSSRWRPLWSSHREAGS